MKSDDRGAAVRPEDEIARRVHRYERALFAVLQMRPAEERTTPITNEEHLLAAQAAEAITAYKRSLRHPPPFPATATPVAKKEGGEAKEASPAATIAARTRRRGPARRRGRPRKKAPQESSATSEG